MSDKKRARDLNSRAGAVCGVVEQFVIAVLRRLSVLGR